MVKYTDKVKVVKGPAKGDKVINQYRVTSTTHRGQGFRVKFVEDGDKRLHAAKVFYKGVMERQFVPRYDKDGMTMETLREKVEYELEVLSKLSHSCIVTLEEVINDPEHEKLYVIMEGLPGGNLMAWDQNRACYAVACDAKASLSWCAESFRSGPGTAPIPTDPQETLVYQEEVAKYIFRQVLEGVVYMHSQGVIHKDLKPENIVLSLPVPTGNRSFVRAQTLVGEMAPLEEAEGCSREKEIDVAECKNFWHLLQEAGFAAKIIDFNSAVVAPSPDHMIFDAEGTQLFTPPECFTACQNGTMGKPRDIWSLGCVLHTMLLGRPPYYADSNWELQLGILEKPVPLLKGVLGCDALSLLQGLLQKNSEARITTEAALQHPWCMM